MKRRRLDESSREEGGSDDDDGDDDVSPALVRNAELQRRLGTVLPGRAAFGLKPGEAVFTVDRSAELTDAGKPWTREDGSLVQNVKGRIMPIHADEEDFGPSYRTEEIRRENVLLKDPRYAWLRMLAGCTSEQVEALFDDADLRNQRNYDEEIKQWNKAERERIMVGSSGKKEQLDILRERQQRNESVLFATQRAAAHLRGLLDEFRFAYDPTGLDSLSTACDILRQYAFVQPLLETPRSLAATSTTTFQTQLKTLIGDVKSIQHPVAATHLAALDRFLLSCSPMLTPDESTKIVNYLWRYFFVRDCTASTPTVHARPVHCLDFVRDVVRRAIRLHLQSNAIIARFQDLTFMEYKKQFDPTDALDLEYAQKITSLQDDIDQLRKRFNADQKDTPDSRRMADEILSKKSQLEDVRKTRVRTLDVLFAAVGNTVDDTRLDALMAAPASDRDPLVRTFDPSIRRLAAITDAQKKTTVATFVGAIRLDPKKFQPYHAIVALAMTRLYTITDESSQPIKTRLTVMGIPEQYGPFFLALCLLYFSNGKNTTRTDSSASTTFQLKMSNVPSSAVDALMLPYATSKSNQTSSGTIELVMGLEPESLEKGLQTLAGEIIKERLTGKPSEDTIKEAAARLAVIAMGDSPKSPGWFDVLSLLMNGTSLASYTTLSLGQDGDVKLFKDVLDLLQQCLAKPLASLVLFLYNGPLNDMFELGALGNSLKQLRTLLADEALSVDATVKKKPDIAESVRALTGVLAAATAPSRDHPIGIKSERGGGLDTASATVTAEMTRLLRDPTLKKCLDWTPALSLVLFLDAWLREGQSKIEAFWTTERDKTKGVITKAEAELYRLVSGDSASIETQRAKVKELYVPSARWQMRPAFTGRIKLAERVTAALDEALALVHAFVPSLAGATLDAFMLSNPESGLPGAFARFVASLMNRSQLTFPHTYNKDYQYRLDAPLRHERLSALQGYVVRPLPDGTYVATRPSAASGGSSSAMAMTRGTTTSVFFF